MTGHGSEPWEVYTVTGDARPDLEGKTSLDLSDVSGDGTCCATDRTDSTTDNPVHDVAVAEKQTAAACC